MISEPKSAIFRKEAVERYLQNREKSILPRFVAPSTFLFLWGLLILFLGALLLAWVGQVPVYVAAPGVVLDPGRSGSGNSDEAIALLFVPYSPSLHLYVGQVVQVQLGEAGTQVTGRLQAIDQHVLSPAQIHQRYQLGINSPSLALHVALQTHLSGQLYAGSAVLAQVQIGSHRLFSLFPVVDTLLKET